MERLSREDGSTDRMGCSPARLSIRPERDGGLAGRVSTIPEHPAAPANALTADEPDTEETAQLIPCDRCCGLYEPDQIVTLWAGPEERLLCEHCYDDVDPSVDRQIDLIRGK